MCSLTTKPLIVVFASFTVMPFGQYVKFWSMIDPWEADAGSAPRSVEDLYVAAKHSHLVAADNIFRLSADVSDAPCVICTGGGYARRAWYTTEELKACAVSASSLLAASSRRISSGSVVIGTRLPARVGRKRGVPNRVAALFRAKALAIP